jgi:hypothetical protein
MDLARLVYEITGKYPAGERFGLTAHIRKSAVSFRRTSPGELGIERLDTSVAARSGSASTRRWKRK